MKKKSKILLVILILLCQMILLCQIATARVDTFFLYEDYGILYFNTILNSIHIPDVYEGHDIKEIGCINPNDIGHDIKTVTMGNSITRIKENAFGWYTYLDGKYEGLGVENVQLSNSLTFIGVEAFAGNKLTEITIPKSVTNIKPKAFIQNQLTQVNFSNESTRLQIDNKAFAENELSSIVLPNSITSIGDKAFSKNKLTSINIPSSVTYLGKGAFQENEIENVDLKQLPTSEVPELLFYDNKIKTLEIPDNITRINDYAFANNKIETLEIPENVEFIGNMAFGYNKLKSIKIYNPDVVIRYNAFTNQDTEEPLTIYGYKDSTAQTYAEKNNINFVDLEGETFEDKGLTFIVDKDNKKVSLKKVKSEAVKNGRLKLPKSVTYKDENYTLTTIKKGAVTAEELYNIIDEIEIPSEVNEIQNGAFYVKAKKIKILSKNITIGENAFDVNVLNAFNSVMYGYAGSGVKTYATNKKIAYRPIKIVDNILFAYDDNSKTADIIRIYDAKVDEKGRVFLTNTIEGYTIKSFNSYIVDSKNIKSLIIISDIDQIDDLAFSNVADEITLVVKKDSKSEQFAKEKNIKYILFEDFPEFEITKDGLLTVYTLKNELIIPDKVDGIQVKDIVKIVPVVNQEIEKITIPDTVKAIKKNLFDDIGLKEITLPYTIEKIEDDALGKNGQEITIKGYAGTYAQQYAIFRDNVKFKVKGYYDGTELYDEIMEDGLFVYAVKHSSENWWENNDNPKIFIVQIKNELSSLTKDWLFIPNKVNNRLIRGIIPYACEISDSKINVAFCEDYSSFKIEDNAFPLLNGEVQLGSVGLAKFWKIGYNAFSSRNVSIKIPLDSLSENANHRITIDSKYYESDGKFLYDVFNNNNLVTFIAEKNIPEDGILRFSDKVTEIESKAFKYNKHYDKVYIPSKVTTIADDAFEDQKNKLTIIAKKNSVAEKYAKDHGMKFEEYEGFDWGYDNYSFDNNAFGFDNYKVPYFSEYFGNELRQALEERESAEDWGGSCAGISCTNYLFYNKYFTPSFWQSEGEANKTYDIDSPKCNSRLKSVINFYQLLCGEIVVSDYETLNSFDETSIEGFFNGVKNYYDNSENKNKVLLCVFTGKNKLDSGETGISGHAVLIIGGPERIDYQHNKDINYYCDEYHSKNYTYRIPIYDSNQSTTNFIYISDKFDKIDVGKHEHWTDPDVKNEYSCINITAAKLKEENFFNFEKCIKENRKIHFEKNYLWVENKDSVVIVKDESSKLVKVKDGEKIEGDLDCKTYAPVYDATAATTRRTDIVANNREYYSVEPENGKDSLDVQVLLNNSFMAAKTEEGGKVEFYNKKFVNLNNPSGKKYELTFTVSEDYMKLPWYTMKLSGETSKDIKIELTEDGYLVTGDSLKNIKIVASNAGEKAELTLNTDAKKVLLKASKDNKELDVYEDKDNDGSFETKTQTATPTATPTEIKDEESITNENNSKIVNTGDSIITYVVMLIIAVIIAIIIYFKYKNKG